MNDETLEEYIDKYAEVMRSTAINAGEENFEWLLRLLIKSVVADVKILEAENALKRNTKRIWT